MLSLLLGLLLAFGGVAAPRCLPFKSSAGSTVVVVVVVVVVDDDECSGSCVLTHPPSSAAHLLVYLLAFLFLADLPSRLSIRMPAGGRVSLPGKDTSFTKSEGAVAATSRDSRAVETLRLWELGTSTGRGNLQPSPSLLFPPSLLFFILFISFFLSPASLLPFLSFPLLSSLPFFLSFFLSLVPRSRSVRPFHLSPLSLFLIVSFASSLARFSPSPPLPFFPVLFALSSLLLLCSIPPFLLLVLSPLCFHPYLLLFSVGPIPSCSSKTTTCQFT